MVVATIAAIAALATAQASVAQTLAPKRLFAPPSDIETRIVVLPEPRASASVSQCALLFAPRDRTVRFAFETGRGVVRCTPLAPDALSWELAVACPRAVRVMRHGHGDLLPSATVERVASQSVFGCDAPTRSIEVDPALWHRRAHDGHDEADGQRRHDGRFGDASTDGPWLVEARLPAPRGRGCSREVALLVDDASDVALSAWTRLLVVHAGAPLVLSVAASRPLGVESPSATTSLAARSALGTPLGFELRDASVRWPSGRVERLAFGREAPQADGVRHLAFGPAEPGDACVRIVAVVVDDEGARWTRSVQMLVRATDPAWKVDGPPSIELSDDARWTDVAIPVARPASGDKRDGRGRHDNKSHGGERHDGKCHDDEVRDGERRDGERHGGERRDYERHDGERRDGEGPDGANDGDALFAACELWAESCDRARPLGWIGGIAEVEPPAGATGHRVRIGCEPARIALAAGEILVCRNIRLHARDGFAPLEVVTRLEALGSASLRGKAFAPPVAAGFGIPGVATLASRAARSFAPGAGSHVLALSPGYCASGNGWPPSHFAQDAWFFENPLQNQSHDELALAIAAGASAFKSFGLIAHSQGGCAALHLYAFYWSGLDWAGPGRLLQAVGSPLQGTPLAGNLAALAEVFGVQCGENYSLSTAGAAAWLSAIPTAARQKLHTFTTTFIDDWWSYDSCHLVTDPFLSDPEDGATEHAAGHIPGAMNMGLKEGWCHVEDMSHPEQTLDPQRNAIMNAEAAR